MLLKAQIQNILIVPLDHQDQCTVLNQYKTTYLLQNLISRLFSINELNNVQTSITIKLYSLKIFLNQYLACRMSPFKRIYNLIKYNQMAETNFNAPFMPISSTPVINHSPLYSHLLEKRLALKARILKKDSSIHKATDLTLLLNSLQNQTNIKHNSVIPASILEEKNKQKQRKLFGYKVEKKKNKQKRLIKLHSRAGSEDDITAFLHLKRSSFFSKNHILEQNRCKKQDKGSVQSTILHASSISQKQYQSCTLQKNELDYRKCKTQNDNQSKVEKAPKQLTTNKIRIRASLQTSPSKEITTSIKQEYFKCRKNKPLLKFDAIQLKHIKAQSYCVMQASGQMVLSVRGNKQYEIASLTKVMTACLVIRICNDLSINASSQVYPVKQYVESMTGTSAELIHGDIYTIQQLLYGLLLPSGNDAAIVLADWGGKLLRKREQDKKVKVGWKNNVKTFVDEMNNYCQTLGLVETRYENPHGLPHPEAKSTAFEQCKLAAFCLKDDLLSKICRTQKFKCVINTTDNRKRQICWQNTNKLLRREGFVGVKTGITVTAGPCLVSGYEFKDKTYIVTVLRSNKVSRRFKDTRKILHLVLSKLHEGNIYFSEAFQLQGLGKNNKDLDSDYSEDEQQFKYGSECAKELGRRNKILINQL